MRLTGGGLCSGAVAASYTQPQCLSDRGWGGGGGNCYDVSSLQSPRRIWSRQAFKQRLVSLGGARWTHWAESPLSGDAWRQVPGHSEHEVQRARKAPLLNWKIPSR